MPKKSLAVSVDITIYSVTCPGVFLKDRDDIFLEVCVFGLHKQSQPVPAVFPLYFNERFKFHKVFYNCVSPLDLHEALSNETVTVEVVQKSRFIHAGVVLASIELTSKDFLFPYPSAVPVYSGADRELLLSKTLHFNGISPKIEFASHTSVNEVHTTAADELSDKIAEINRENNGKIGSSSTQEKLEAVPSVDAPPQVPATASQAGSGGYKASVSTSELMGEDGGAQPGPQEGILIAKEISKTQNSRKTTPNYVTTCTSYKLLDKKTAAAVRKIPNVGPNLPKSGNNLKPPVAKPSSTKRKVLPKKRASLGVQTDRSEVQSEPCALCEAAQTARPEVTYIKERNSDQKKRTRETERAHRIPPIALGSIAGSTSSRNNAEHLPMAYSEERNRCFNGRVPSSAPDNSSSRKEIYSQLQRSRRVQNLSLIQCFNEAYWAKQRSQSSPEIEIFRVDESWETTSVSSVEVFETQNVPPLVNLELEVVPREAIASATEMEKEVIHVGANWEESSDTPGPVEEGQFAPLVPDPANDSILTNFDADSFLSLSPSAFSPNTSSSPKPASLRKQVTPKHGKDHSTVEATETALIIRSDSGGGDRPVLKHRPQKAPSSCGARQKLLKLAQNQKLLADKTQITLGTSNLNMVAKHLAENGEKFRGKSLTVKVCKNFEGNPKVVVTDCRLVKQKVLPTLKFQQSKSNSSNFKVVKHVPRSASPTRALNRSKSLSSFKGTALMEKPPFVVRKVDRDILKMAEPMAATVGHAPLPAGRRSRSKRRKSGKRSKSAAGRHKTYLVEKHYDDYDVSDHDDFNEKEEPLKFEQNGFGKYNLDVAEESEEGEEEEEADQLGKASSKVYSSAPVRKSYDDARAERFLSSPVDYDFYPSEFSDLVLDRLERKRLLEELERDARLSRLHGPYLSSSETYAQKYEQELYWARKRRELERSLDRLYDRLYRLH